MSSRKRRVYKNPRTSRRNLRHIILPEEVVSALFEWHGGAGSYVYSLASIGMHNYVSVSMVEKAMDELERTLPRIKRKADRRHLQKLIGDLSAIVDYPEEFSAEGSGADPESYEFDPYED